MSDSRGKDEGMTHASLDSNSHIVHAPGGFLAAGSWDGIADLADLTKTQTVRVAAHSTLEFSDVTDADSFAVLAAQLGFYTGPERVIVPPLLPRNAEAAVAECAWSLLPGSELVEIQVGGQPHLGVADARTHILGGQPDSRQVEVKDVIGWISRDDGTVSLGAALEDGVISSYLARLLGVIGTPSAITPFGTVLIHNLSEAIADQVLRVLPGMGMIFDADTVNQLYSR